MLCLDFVTQDSMRLRKFSSLTQMLPSGNDIAIRGSRILIMYMTNAHWPMCLESTVLRETGWLLSAWTRCQVQEYYEELICCKHPWAGSDLSLRAGMSHSELVAFVCEQMDSLIGFGLCPKDRWWNLMGHIGLLQGYFQRCTDLIET